ncbi:hypothetical protein BH23ACT6_BH23ACT6_05690 [soil metagenome]
MGLLDKVYVQFDEIFWETDVDFLGYVEPKRGYFAEWLNIAKHDGEPMPASTHRAPLRRSKP